MSKIYLLPFIITQFLLVSVRAGSWTVGKDSSLSFVSKITGGSFLTTSSQINGTVTTDDTGTKILSAIISVPVKSLDSGMTKRNEHMREKYLKADAFPQITLELQNVAISLTESAQQTFNGIMNITGVQKPVKSTATIKKGKKPDTWEIEASLDVNILDFNIPQPQFLVVKMQPELKITTQLFLEKAP